MYSHSKEVPRKTMEQSTKHSERQHVFFSIILLALALVFFLTAVFFSASKRPVSFRVPAIDDNATKIPGQSIVITPSEKPSDNSTSGNVTYTDRVEIDSETGKISLMFQNPSGSDSDMVLHVLVDGQEVATSGLLPTGYQISDLDLNEGVSIAPGEYTGSFKVDHFSSETGEKAIFSLDIETSVFVT